MSKCVKAARRDNQRKQKIGRRVRRKGTKKKRKKWRVGIFRLASTELRVCSTLGPISSAAVVLAQVGKGPPFPPPLLRPWTHPPFHISSRTTSSSEPLLSSSMELSLSIPSPFFCVPLGSSPLIVPSPLCGFLGTISETVWPSLPSTGQDTKDILGFQADGPVFSFWMSFPLFQFYASHSAKRPLCPHTASS